MKNNILHYLIDPGKPAQNGKVERSHRTDQEMFYDRRKFKTILGLSPIKPPQAAKKAAARPQVMHI